MKRTVFVILVFISILVLIVLAGGLFSEKILRVVSKGGLKVTAVPNADVFINDKPVGATPYQDENLETGEVRVKIASGSAMWQGQVRINEGTLSVVNREIAENQASASGEILTLNAGSGAVITSTPTGSGVEVDGKNVGNTPLSLSSLTMGDHTFTLSHDGYLKRSIRAFVPDKLKLNLDVDLAISEVDLSTVVAPPVQVEQQMVVKSTPTGFLRVRDKAGLDGQEVERVNPGTTVTFIEERNGWTKVTLPDGKQGYVSSQYLSRPSNK